MKTNKYLKSLLEGSGHLNPFPVKTTESSPDYGGYLKIQGQNYRIVAWVKESNGRKTLSIKANEADDHGVVNLDLKPLEL
jgi:hypothetical protein